MEAISNRQIEQMIDDIFIKQDRITLCTTGVQPGPAPDSNQSDWGLVSSSTTHTPQF